jgi:hypothetical protein
VRVSEGIWRGLRSGEEEYVLEYYFYDIIFLFIKINTSL